MYKEEQSVLLLKIIMQFIGMELQLNITIMKLVFLILELAEEEFGINAWLKLPRLIEKNSVKEFTEFIKLELLNVKNYIIIVNNVATKLFPN